MRVFQLRSELMKFDQNQEVCIYFVDEDIWNREINLKQGNGEVMICSTKTDDQKDQDRWDASKDEDAT